MSQCIFCSIVNGAIPSNKIFESDEMIAIHDIHPVAPVHFLLIPKLHISSMLDVKDEHHELLGKILVKAPSLAKGLGLSDGFRTVINTGASHGQSVFHLHVHVIGNPSQDGLKAGIDQLLTL